MRDAPKAPVSIVALTGARSDLGTELLRQLNDDPSIDCLIALDISEPDVISDKLLFRHMDLTAPTAGLDLTRILSEFAPDTLIHGAFLSTPSHDESFAHELEDVGTMHVLDACARVQPTRLMLLSTTLVYGALASNPNYLREDASLSGFTASRFVNDKVKVEEQVLRFARNYPEIDVCSLRFAPILGPTAVNLFTRFLSRPLAPTVAGYDPLLQCVHQYDATRAALLALTHGARGVYNIVGKDVLPYSTILAMLGRLPLPMPAPLVRLIGRAMWAARISEVPGTLVDLLQHLCVADGRKAATELGFEPEYDIRETLYDFLGVPSAASPGAPSPQSFAS